MSEDSARHTGDKPDVSWLRRNRLFVVVTAVAVVVLGGVTAVLVPLASRPAHLSAGRGAEPADAADANQSGEPDPSTDASGQGALGTAAPTPSASKAGAGANTGRPPSMSGYPDASNTGVPASVHLSAYTGPCTITAAGTVIDGKQVNCSIGIKAKGVVIKNSKVNGQINTDEGTAFSFTLQDTEVDAGLVQGAAVASTNMKLLHANIHGGVTSVYCYANCDIRESYLHGQRVQAGADWHLGGFLANDNGNDPGGHTNAMLVHNTIICDTPPTSADGGCSGDVNLFGDFGPVSTVTVDGNLLGASSGVAYCIFGGSSTGKPFQPDHVVIVNNVFRRGSTNKCGAYGPVTGFDAGRPGNQWANNVWDDKSPVAAAN